VKFTSNDAWRASALQLPESLKTIKRSDSGVHNRVALFALWRQIALAPAPIQHLYGQISENTIRETAEQFEKLLGYPNWGLTLKGADDDQEIVKNIGGLLRALDLYLKQFLSGSHTPTPNDDWRVEWNGEEAFLIPLARLPWRAPKGEEKDFRPFSQRGLLCSRIVPAAVDGANVRLYYPDRIARIDQELTFGAALFPQLSFDIVDSSGAFRVTGVSAPDLAKNIAEACEGACAAQCLAAVFPELTINDTSLRQIKRLLAGKPWWEGERGSFRAAPIVVAGSWHEAFQSGYVNVATVLDGEGNLLLRHQKRFAYRDDEGRPEDIIPGQELSILVLNEGLFSFGICLDFCHRGFETPYGELDVDFVLVPSCGNAATMEGHVRTACDLHDRRKTRSFVVQQAFPEISEGIGYVLCPDGAPKGKSSADLAEARSWSICKTVNPPGG
jgi:hypothetical protein